jgi:outer membrane receptor protein involved in Fe transport
MGGTFEPFLTINNLFDKAAPLVASNIPGVNTPTIFSLYDTIGRAYTAGVRFKF